MPTRALRALPCELQGLVWDALWGSRARWRAAMGAVVSALRDLGSAVHVLQQSVWQARRGVVYITDEEVYCPQCGEQALFFASSEAVCADCCARRRRG